MRTYDDLQNKKDEIENFVNEYINNIIFDPETYYTELHPYYFDGKDEIPYTDYLRYLPQFYRKNSNAKDQINEVDFDKDNSFEIFLKKLDVEEKMTTEDSRTSTFINDEKSEFLFYLGRQTNNLTASQKESFIEWNLKGVKLFLQDYSLLLMNKKNSISELLDFKVFFSNIKDDQRVNDFIFACGFLEFGDDIPCVLDAIHKKGDLFIYDEDDDFILNKCLLHLLDYELFLLNTIMESDPYENVMPILNELEGEDHQCLQRIGNGLYRLTCSITKFIKAHIELKPDLDPSVHYPILIKKAGKKCSDSTLVPIPERSLYDRWNELKPIK